MRTPSRLAPLLSRSLRLPALLALAALVPGAAACDTTFLTGPKPEIDRGPVIDDGDPSEGEGEAGEGEGEVDGPVAVCGGQFTVAAGEPIATNTTRARHAAVLLKDGRVLVAGGHDEATWTSIRSAEIFDPATGTFASTGALLQARFDFALVALEDGRALAVGGFNNDIDSPDDNGDLATLELFDPETGTWSAGPEMPEARSGLSAVNVASSSGAGRVLIFGGQTGAESIPTAVLAFDPIDDSLSTTGGAVSFGRTAHAAHVLSDGRVLMIGGYYTGVRDDVDVISPDGAATRVDGIPGARRSSCAANDADGRLLVFGGYSGSSLGDVQAFSPADDSWSSAGVMQTGRFACAAVELSCATLVCGGVDATSCEVRDHGADESVVVVEDTGSEFSGSLTALDGERALLVGGFVGDGVSGTARVIELVSQ